MSFWQHASTQQRLAQIDGAISVGMTMRQTAMNLGTYKQNIADFAHKHGRSFAGYSVTQQNVSSDNMRNVAHLGRMAQHRNSGREETDLPNAFEIFPSRAKEDHILDKRGDE
jgi:hypothetical protein